VSVFTLHLLITAAELIDAIKKCPKLICLNLEGNSLGVEAAKCIGEALKTHPEFERALFKDLFTGRMKDEIPAALEAMGEGMRFAHAKLTVFDCSDNALGPNGMKGLVELFRSSTCYTLQELRLNNCGLGIQGAKMLAQSLLACHTKSVEAGTPFALKVFVAGRNRLENEGAKALAEVFAAIKSLEHLSIPQNGIYHPGITALSNALKENPNLSILNFNDNTIGPKGALALSEALYSVQKYKFRSFRDLIVALNGFISTDFVRSTLATVC
jgi:Ran GTPase-activating protein 1